MKKLTEDDPETKSPDLITQNVEELKRLFPEAFTEGKIDFEVLKQLLGGAVEEREEKYGLNWHGKRAARQIALTPSAGTLRPAPEESVDWDTTKNLMIEGDNLEVLKLLQKSYAGRVKLIYIDPPYNTGKEFVYPDAFQDNIKSYLEITGQIGDSSSRLSSNTETSGRYHTDWLNMMYPRLKLARNLLRDDGVIFISIDDNEVGNLQNVLSDLFGEENFQAKISWQKRYTRSNNTVDFTAVIEYLLVYSKSEEFIVNLLERTAAADARYANPDQDHRGPWKGASFLNPATPHQRPNLSYPIKNPNTGQVTTPTTNAWRRSLPEFQRLQEEGRLYWGLDGTQPVPAIKMFLAEARDITPINYWEHSYAGNTDDGSRELVELFGERVFDNPKPLQLMARVLDHGSDPDAIVLDFFAGSGGMGHAVMLKNATDGGHRRYILVQLPEVLDPNDSRQRAAAQFCELNGLPASLSEITKERLRRAGTKVEKEFPMFAGDIGFRVFKLSPSNLRPWRPDPETLEQSMITSVDHVVDGATGDALLYEALIKLGLDLSVSVNEYTIGGKPVRSVGSGVLIVCFASAIDHGEVEELARGIARIIQELAPVVEPKILFRDSAFVDDIAKTNMVAILSQNGFGQVQSI